MVTETLRSGWLSTGPKCRALEEAVAAREGMKYGVAVNSATAGLFLALKAAGIGQGDEVVTSPFSFVASTSVILQAGARPVFADIDARSLLIDPESVARCITRKTKAILSVDIAGRPVAYDSLRSICRKHKLTMIADASHSLGAQYNGKSPAQWADMAVHSFYVTKNLACGEGGMVLTGTKTLADRVRLLSRHAITSNAYQRRQTGSIGYDVVGLGYKANMSDILASVGLGQLQGLDTLQEQRRKLAERYLKNLRSLQDYLILPEVSESFTHAWHLFIIQLKLEWLDFGRDEFIARMAERGIECGIHYYAIPSFSYYRRLGVKLSDYPNTAKAARRIVTLPLYPGLKPVDVDFVCEAIAEILQPGGRRQPTRKQS